MNSEFYDNISFDRTIENGFIWDKQSIERMQDPTALESYGYKVYSQNDEDGIIHEIFKRIGTTNKTFIEFGVQDGLESNCHLLLLCGWKGFWLEGSEDFCRQIRIKFRPVIESGQLKLKHAFITRENINELFTEIGAEGEIDLLSIDIDGNDWYVWKAVDAVNPRVVVTEYNGKFPPDLEWKQAYNPRHVWDGTDWQGASLKAFENLGREKGYRLVGTNLRGCNAFFVREDLAADMFYKLSTAEALYNPLRMNLQYIANHPAGYCLAGQKDGFGILNYEKYELVSGFHEVEGIAGKEQHVWTSETASCFRIFAESGCREIVIPVRLSNEVLERGRFEVRMGGEGVKDFQVILTEHCTMCRVALQEITDESRILELEIKIPYTWRACDYSDSKDQRELGINILLSGIEYNSVTDADGCRF